MQSRAMTAAVVPFSPAVHALNRARLCELLGKLGEARAGESVALLQGGEAQERHETDHEELFRQESNFAWAFGVKEPGCFGAIHVATKQSWLFVPRYPADYGIWMGVRSLESLKAEYGVDQVFYVDELGDRLRGTAKTTRGPRILTTRGGLNTDTGRRCADLSLPSGGGLESFRMDNGVLYDAICELRAIKTDLELRVLAHVCRITSEAHCQVMRETKPGMREFQLESMFLHFAYFHGGCRHTSYTSICGCGPSGSVLHYGHAGAPNERLIGASDLCLLDMGAEGHFYGSDVTCTFPASGRFTPDQRAIYQTVLDAQWAVMARLKPGVFYVDMQELVYRIICEGLRDRARILVGDLDAMMACNLGAVFMPHGLGHMLGIDTHDVGGKPEFSTVSGAFQVKADSRDGYKKIRLLRALEKGMYITVEPGVYFIDYLLDQALADPVQSKFINASRVKEFRGFGGVRLEDDVVVTDTGVVNYTRCPRTVEDIEGWMGGKIPSVNDLKCPWSVAFA